MQISATSSPDLEVTAEPAASNPLPQSPLAKARKRDYIPYLIFAFCASFVFPSFHAHPPGNGDEGTTCLRRL